jgi:hypothetical protein
MDEKGRTVMESAINRKGLKLAKIEFIRVEGHTYYKIESPGFKTIDEAINHAYDLLGGSDVTYSVTNPRNLRTCPHCGCDSLLFRIYNEKKMDDWYIQCVNEKCGYGGGVYPTIQEAIDNWNNW